MIDRWYLAHLVCPTHRSELEVSAGGSAAWSALRCHDGCRFSVVHGIPVMLPTEPFRVTHENAAASLRDAADPIAAGIGANSAPTPDTVDAWVQEMVAHTNSTLYTHLVGRLERYPIPRLPMEPKFNGATLLDIGCGWGRWALAAARQGFSAVGIDTSLSAALAATRVAEQLGVPARYVVADSRFLPFKRQSFDAAWSYSVLQHFAKDDVVATLASLRSLMRAGGTSKLHVLNALGLRSLFVQARRGFRTARGFETRYWVVDEIRRAFEHHLGPSQIEVDGFFVQGRYEDRLLFRPRDRLIVDISRRLTGLAGRWGALSALADNLFIVTQH